MTSRRDHLSWITLAAFALSAAILILTLPSLFAAPEQWQRGLAAASGGLALLLGIAMILRRTRLRDVRHRVRP